MSARSRVGFIHWGSWGDLYVGAAALREAVDMFPESDLFVIGPDKWAQIIDQRTWPTIKGLIASDDGWNGTLFVPDGSDGWRKDTPVKLISFFKTVRASFNLRTESLRFAWAPFLAGVPERHGSAEFPWSQILYTHRAPWLGKDPVIHERDRMLQVVEAPDRIGVLAAKWSQSSGLPRMKTPVQANADRYTHATFGRYWLINPTSSRREKAWPAEKFAELYQRLAPLLAERGIRLLVTGAPWETEWLREVAPSSEVIVQPPTIQDLLDVLGGAQMLITNTSSVQFLTPGLEVQTLTLMGRANPLIWGPLGRRDIVVRGEIDPALDHDIFAQERKAYESISVERVLQICRDAIKPA